MSAVNTKGAVIIGDSTVGIGGGEFLNLQKLPTIFMERQTNDKRTSFTSHLPLFSGKQDENWEFL